MEQQKYPKYINGRVVLVRTPIMRENGKWVCAEVLTNGYLDLPIYVEFDLEEEAQKACIIHNKYAGYDRVDVDKIVYKSMKACGLDIIDSCHS